MSLTDRQHPFFRKESHSATHVSQGDIIADVTFAFGSGEVSVVLDEVSLPYAIVLSQECDLKQDFDSLALGTSLTNYDKCLSSILICPAYTKDMFLTGDHLEEKKMRKWHTNEAKYLESNSSLERYHLFCNGGDFELPDLVIDFKHFYTLPRELLYKIYIQNYKASLKPLFKEFLSQRFCNYLSRIGLPD